MRILIAAFIYTYCLLIASTGIKAQSIQHISGKIVNHNNEVMMGNVSLLSVRDSTLIKQNDFLDGTFELAAINQNKVIIRFASVEFNTTFIDVNYNGNEHINLGTIIVKGNNNQLNEVVIKNQTSPIKYGPNGSVEVNVTNTILSTSSSVNELLGRVPNVIVTEGQISVLGKGEAIIYLNGILISTERFAAIPVSQIAKIEVISNPSSKYDAEGKAVINIITKKNKESGIMGTANQQVTVSKFAGTSTNSLLDFNYNKGKFSFITNFGLQLGHSRELLYTTRIRPDPTEYMKSELTTDWKRRFNNYSNFGFGLQYSFSDSDYISIEYSGNIEDLGGVVESRNSILTNSSTIFYATDVDKNDVRLNQFINLNYNVVNSTNGSSLFIGMQYSNYNSMVKDLISENGLVDVLNSGRFLKNNADYRINIINTQADYSKKISDNSKLEFGAKLSTAAIKTSSYFLISDKNNPEFELNDQLSSDFKYDEQIGAAYFNYSSSLSDKFNFSVGARGEWTNYELNTTANGKQQFKKNYINIFPNLLVNMPVSDDLKLHASYVSRITRPRYQGLNPYVIYQDPFTTIEGNPNLKPEKIHAFEVGALYKKFDFKLGYNYKIDPITGAALRGNNPNSYILKGINMDKEDSYFASISRSLATKWWSSTNTVSMNYSKLVDNTYSFALGRATPQIYLYSNNTFTIPKLFKIQLLAWYLGDKGYGLGEDNKRSTVTLGVERTFLDNALKLNFTANDIFKGFNRSGNYEVGQTEIYYHRTYTTNYFKLIATYNFGNSKKTDYKKKEIEQTENSRAR
ncbi:TonB-dependent receptor [Flavobacterium branchiarum]|uniref:TonB-dependent receptor domain-containing protein n=1 Tax=Flavobacterium branchiarum TaxID=1114870 RepID=A0ABV5FRJ1_9FLAO|nr:TonB-dependent receptor [Flavobacterium branchiarum]MDN3673285.1 TonB-dependent receptor [Flavobacterium branchiarum]